VDLSARLLSSGCVDRMVATLNAAAQLGMEWLTGRPVVWTLRALSSIHGEQAAAIEDKLRAVAAPALRWLLDPSRDVSFGKFLGWTAGSFGTALAANLYGREEGGADAQFVFLVEHLHNLVRSTYHLHDTSNLIKALEWLRHVPVFCGAGTDTCVPEQVRNTCSENSPFPSAPPFADRFSTRASAIITSNCC
jgi:hypothetical protein